MSSNKEERQELIQRAFGLKEEIDYAEYQLPNILKSIRELKPSKAELEEGLQDLFDEYLS